MIGIKNNIVIGQHSTGVLTEWMGDGDDANVELVWDNNIYYHPNNATPFYYKDVAYNFADWKTQTSNDANAANENPDLVDYTDYSDIDNFVPSGATAGCVDVGSSLGLPYNFDFDNNLRPYGSGWDMGAFEFGAVAGGDTNVGVIGDFR